MYLADVAEPVAVGVARGVGELDGVADHVAVDEHALGLGREALEVGGRQPLRDLRRGSERAADDRRLLPHVRVVDEQLEQEAVDLRLGQRVRALGLDRVLRREHQERRRHRMRLAADRHLALLHHLEQRRLHLGRRAVDLVGEQEVAEHRPQLGVEAAGVRPVDARADEVGGHEVGRELDAAEGAAEHVGERAHGQGLGEAGHALEQHVAAGQQRDQQALEHRVLADDHALDLVQRPLDGAANGNLVFGHGGDPASPGVSFG